MKYLYTYFNEDYPNIIKYNCSKKLNELHYDLTKPSKYINIYKINKNKNYKLKNIKYDKIISIFARDEKYIEIIESLYNTKFENLRKIKQYILNNNFINYNGFAILDILINYEFKKLGLDVIKISEKTINKLNKKNVMVFNKNIEKNIKKYELYLIENISKSVN